jgi:hypothetical protein
MTGRRGGHAYELALSWPLAMPRNSHGLGTGRAEAREALTRHEYLKQGASATDRGCQNAKLRQQID